MPSQQGVFYLFQRNFEHAGSVSQIMTFQFLFTTNIYMPVMSAMSNYLTKIWDYHKKWVAILH